IEEEVYVCQPPGFEDPDHPDKSISFPGCLDIMFAVSCMCKLLTTDSDYARATQDRKSNNWRLSVLGNRADLLAMQKQTVVAHLQLRRLNMWLTASCCGQIDTEHNVADLLTKGFDAGRFQYLVSSIGMLNP
ncbi:hypothetical protein Tco_0262651, partial [Tanacetum coccineum]